MRIKEITPLIVSEAGLTILRTWNSTPTKPITAVQITHKIAVFLTSGFFHHCGALGVITSVMARYPFTVKWPDI
jgi:hypothetical protein